jgi:hypothetical protein
MRLRGGVYECAECGAAINVARADESRVQIQIHQAGGSKQTLRVMTLDGCEIHRCQIASTRKSK